MKQVQCVPHIRLDDILVEEPLRLAHLRVVQRLDAPSQCQISWLAPSTEVRAVEALGIAPGISLKIHIEAQPYPIFKGEITAVEHLHQPAGELVIRVRAYDRLVCLQQRQSLQTRVDVSTAELARVLVEASGLKVNAPETGPVWPRVIPRFGHDLALLRHYTSRSGLHFVVEQDELHLFSFKREQDPPLELSLGDDLFEVRIERNAIRPLARAQVLGWDVHTAEARQSQSVSTPQPAFGASASHQRKLFGAAVESESEAEALANAELERGQAASLVMWGVAEGDVTLRPGRRVHINGVASSMAGPHRLHVVTHTVDAEGGFLSELSSRAEPVDDPAAFPTIVLGEVCDVDDPEQRGRIQVVLPSYSDAAST
jgi:hypothetical protein